MSEEDIRVGEKLMGHIATNRAIAAYKRDHATSNATAIVKQKKRDLIVTVLDTQVGRSVNEIRILVAKKAMELQGIEVKPVVLASGLIMHPSTEYENWLNSRHGYSYGAMQGTLTSIARHGDAIVDKERIPWLYFKPVNPIKHKYTKKCAEVGCWIHKQKIGVTPEDWKDKLNRI